MSETIYIISGLGADQRVFCNIDFTNKNVVFIHWIQSLPNEKIDNYALRLSAFITTPHPIIIGLSFGGIVAIEIAKIIPTKLIILISSVKHYSEMPMWYKLAGALRLNKIIPFSLFKKANFLTYYFFGVNTIEQKQLLKTIFQETNTQFLRWAINCIVNWNNNFIPILS